MARKATPPTGKTVEALRHVVHAPPLYIQEKVHPKALIVGLLLDDADAENGAMAVLPGSHFGPVHEHFDGDRFAWCTGRRRTCRPGRGGS